MVEDFITYVCVSTPNLEKLKRNLDLIAPFVDRSVIVIGKRDTEAESYLKSVPNLTLVYRPWDDSFRAQYQSGLDQIDKGWMLWLDDDEVPSKEMLSALRPIITESCGATKFDTVAFRCCDVWDGEVGQPGDYYREILTAWNPNLHFEIDLHQAMVGKMRGARAALVYYHYKNSGSGLRGSCRNFFIAGVWADGADSFPYWYEKTGQDPRFHPGGPLVPNSAGCAFPLRDGFRIDAWHEMKDILKEHHPEVQNYADLDVLIRNNTVCKEFKDWAFRHNEVNDTRPHVGEMHAFDKYINSFAGKEG